MYRYLESTPGVSRTVDNRTPRPHVFAVAMSVMDYFLIKTIQDGDEVPNYSQSSDEEEEFQPKKRKNKKKRDFDAAFKFADTADEYNRNAWDDLSKYIKRKARSKVDEKIEKQRKLMKQENNATAGDNENNANSDDEDQKVSENDSDPSDSEVSLSEDELKKDNIRVKERNIKKKNKKKIKLDYDNDENQAQIEFEDAPPYDEKASFYEMNLSRPLMKAITAMNFITPTPIQAATIPIALMGRDVCGCAATGTGKTAAYMLPTLERLLYRPGTAASVTRVVVLVPTRELGVQVYQVTRQLAQFTSIQVALSVGGLDLKVQESVLRKSPDVVIATPGRLIDHLKNTPSFSLDNVEVLILDEADRMLDEYFQEQMTEIIRECSRTRQTLLFSATMTEAVESLAAVSLTRPVRIFVDNNQAVAANLRQEFIKIRKEREGDREPVVAALVCRTFRDHVMIFVQTKKQAHRLHILLGLMGVKVGELHGNLTQIQRLEALRKFKDEEVDVLVATDVAARGLDIRGVKTVINFVLPVTLEHYIHRVGRTARAGKCGVSVSLTGEGERSVLKQIIKNAKNPVKARLIPSEVLSKYRKKVTGLEEKIKGILDEEWEEKELAKAEAQANKAEKILKMDTRRKKMKKNDPDEEQERLWFQDKKQRQSEKERLKLTPEEGAGKGDSAVNTGQNQKKGRAQRRKKNKEKGGGESMADARVKNELEKVALYQARIAKRTRKPKKLKAVVDGSARSSNRQNNAGGKRKKSSFEKDLTDVSRKGVKMLRHQATEQRNAERFGKRGVDKKSRTPGKKAAGGGGGFGRKVNQKSKRR